MAGDSLPDGVALDPSKCNKLSMEEKRELVYQMSKWPNGASEMLQTWSRQDILQILCAEMGKERKYTGLTKLKIIENLLRLVSEKNSAVAEDVAGLETQSSPANDGKTAKRQRKTDNPSRLPVPPSNVSLKHAGNDSGNTLCCKNSACRAVLNKHDAFCKRCSCCICHQYDDNKDPSLWLLCSSDPPFQGDSCGMSCHLDCALKDGRSDIGKGQRAIVDGSFCCVSCGKLNDLLGCWRKQLMKAKDTRRVDILCYRVSLCQKILNGTEKYLGVHEIVNEAVKKLEAEVGPLIDAPVKMGRGIVNRLSSGPEVQKLCDNAVALLDSMLSDQTFHPVPSPMIRGSNVITPSMVRFEDVSSTSLAIVIDCKDVPQDEIVCHTLWHRKCSDRDYPVEPTCSVYALNRKFDVMGLAPSTEYQFKIVSFLGTRQLGECEVQFSTSNAGNEVSSCLMMERSQSSDLSNPSSVEDETNNMTLYRGQSDNQTDNYLSQGPEKIVSANLSSDAIDCSKMSEGGMPAVTVSFSDVPNSDGLKLHNNHSSEDQTIEDTSADNGSDSLQPGMECVPYVKGSEASLPVTPCKMELPKDGVGRNGRSKSSSRDPEYGTQKGGELRDGSISKKRSGERADEDCVANGTSDRNFEYYVKLIRWLECEGHIEKNFRQRFLTWYSLRANPQEVRVVKAFVDTFSEDPAALAEQLVDTFSECISSKKASVVPSGLCMKLWH